MIVIWLSLSYVEYNFQGCVYDGNIFTVLLACADGTASYDLSPILSRAYCILSKNIHMNKK